MTTGQREVKAARPGPGAGRVTLAVILLLLLAIVALVVWGIRSITSAVPSTDEIAAMFEPDPFEEIGPTVVRSIRDLANLTTVELVEYTIVEKGTDGGFLNWANGDSLQLFAVARIGAGVDLGEITVRSFEVGEDGVVEMTIPKATIQYVAVDNDATQIIDRSTGLFTKGDPRLETDARRLAEDVLQQAALDAGILERAETNAHDVIANFLLSLGYRDVVIEFR